MTRGPIDEAYFKQLPYWQQWDAAVKFLVETGTKSAAPALILHMFWCCIQWLVIWGTTALVAGAASGVDYYYILTRTALMSYSLIEFLGWSGMWQGPAYGNLKPPFPLTWSRFHTGTIKEPFFDFLGDTRSLLDVSLAYAVIPVMIYLILTPTAGMFCWLWPAWVWAFFLLDFSTYVGMLGSWFGPVSVVIAVGESGIAGSLAGLQLVILMLWFGCGVGKHGPWFCNLFASEWNLPAFCAGSKCMNRLFYRDPDNEVWIPTRFAKVVGYLASACEWGSPLLILLTPGVVARLGLEAVGPSCVYFGLFILISMHAYIILHIPMADVNMINTIPVMWALYCFKFASTGFDYADFEAMPLALKVFLACFFVHMLYGQRHSDQISYMNCWRFWAGNWPQSWFLMSKSGVEKMKALPSRSVFPPSEGVKAMGLMSSWEADYLDIYFGTYMWFTQLCSRIFPALLHEITGGKPLHECSLFYGMLVTNHCLGPASNCVLRAKHLLPRLQRACQFEEGECIWIACFSFPSFGRYAQYEVVDLKTGKLCAGKWSTDDASALGRPSDCQSLASKLPLKASA